jgi:parvulin-like peptidyl-prolyl isomerase
MLWYRIGIVCCLSFLALAGTVSRAAQRAPVASIAGSAASSASSDVIAQAGSLTLNGNEVRTLIATLPANERAAATRDLISLEQVVRAELIRRTVLSELKTQAFAQRPDVAVALDHLRDQALVRLWVESQARVPADYPSPAEISAAYEANKQALASPTVYHLAQLFISAPDGVEPAKLSAALRKSSQIEAQLDKADFGALARSQSEDPQSAARGGDLGEIPENQLAPEIAAVVRTMKNGQTVGPIKTARGLHFLKLMDEKPGTVPTLAQAHDTLVSALRQRRASDLERAYLSQLDAKLGVTVNQIELAKLEPTLAK